MSTSSELRLASARSKDRLIPPEILERIFSHCDPSTLAIVTRTNLACLELSSRFLYADVCLDDMSRVLSLLRHIDIPSPVAPSEPKKRWWRKAGWSRAISRVVHLLQKPKPAVAPLFRPDRISRYLSLDQVHSVTFNVKDNVRHLGLLAPDILARQPLPVHVLTLRLPTLDWERPVKVNALLRLFNPKFLLVEGRHFQRGSQINLGGPPALLNIASDPKHAPAWDRLSAIVLRNAHIDPDGTPGRISVVQQSATAAGGEPRRRVRLVYPAHNWIMRHSTMFLRRLIKIAWTLSDHGVEVDIEVWVYYLILKQALDGPLKALAEGDAARRMIHVEPRPERVLALFEEAWQMPRRGLDWAALEEM